jgi:hypothetical protein
VEQQTCDSLKDPRRPAGAGRQPWMVVWRIMCAVLDLSRRPPGCLVLE